MGGDEQLGFLGRHVAHRLGPFQGIPLDLLWIAAVGEHPDELIASRDHLVLRDPGPGVIVGFTQAVVELKGRVADLDGHLVSIRRVRFEYRFRQERSLGGLGEVGCCAAKLAQVDDSVVARGGPVPGEARRKIFLAYNPRFALTSIDCIGSERT